MNAVEIEEAVSKLAEQPFNAAEFPFDFLQAFGNKETTLKRLRKGDSNKSDVGGVLQTNNIHIAVASAGDVSRTLEALRVSPATAKAKSKFILVTDGEDSPPEIPTCPMSIPGPTQRFPRRIDLRVDYSLRMTWFDNSLHVVKQAAFAPDEWLSTIHAIYRTPEGGYVLASCEGFQGPSFLRYLTPAGQFSQRQTFPSRNQCDQFALGPGKERGTVVVLGSTLSEASAFVAKYSD